MKKLFTLTFVVILATVSYSQRFENAVGLRGGYGSGITFKHNMEGFVVEAIGAFRSNYGYFGVLGELYTPLEVDLPGEFNIFYGGGAHVINYRYRFFGSNITDTFFGLDGIVGVEYELVDYPLNISIDVKPELNFAGYGFGWGSALSARYEF